MCEAVPVYESRQNVLKYQAVIDDIVEGIESGAYAPYSQLPSTAQLCEKYGVSKITIKKAMDQLEAMGYISRRRGSGSFVKKIGEKVPEALMGEYSNQMTGFMAEHRARSEKVSTKVLQFTVERPSDKVAHALDMDKDGFVYHIVRVRSANDVPLAIEYTYMPIDVIPDLKTAAVETSIYSFIEGDLGLKISSAHRTVRAVLPTQLEVEELHESKTSPLLEVEQTAFLDDGKAFEYSISRHAHGYELYVISAK